MNCNLKEYWKVNKRAILRNIRKAENENTKRNEIISHINHSMNMGYIVQCSEFSVADIERDIYRSL